MFHWPRNSKSTSGLIGTVFIHFWKFRTIHVFEVKESIDDISTELPCSSYLENLSQLPVQGYLEGTDDCILRIFTISSLFMFSRSRNPLLTFRLNYDVWLTSKIQVNFQFERYLWFCHKFLKFSHYSCFWGQGIHCWYFFIATMFRWPRKSRKKSRKTSGPARTQGYWWLCFVDFRNFFTIHVFKVRNSFDDIPTELPCLGDFKNSDHLLVQEVFELIQTFVPWQKSSKLVNL